MSNQIMSLFGDKYIKRYFNLTNDVTKLAGKGPAWAALTVL